VTRSAGRPALPAATSDGVKALTVSRIPVQRDVDQALPVVDATLLDRLSLADGRLTGPGRPDY
jgi:hypothetical protein